MSVINQIRNLENILSRCQRLDDIYRYIDCDSQSSANFDYINLVVINIFQIGDYIKDLSEDFKLTHNIVSWSDIKILGQTLMSDYNSLTVEFLSSKITNEMAKLKKYCQEQLDMIMAQLSPNEIASLRFQDNQIPPESLYSIEEIRRMVSPIARRYDLSRMWLCGLYAIGKAAPESELGFRLIDDEYYHVDIDGLWLDIEAALAMEISIIQSCSNENDSIKAFYEKEFYEYEVLIYEKI